LTGDKVISADKMMNKAKGPVWHKKHKDKGFIPNGLRGLDQQARWCKSNADGWVYGHGSFSLTSHQHPVLGCFVWMKNSANEAKRMWLEGLRPWLIFIDFTSASCFRLFCMDEKQCQ
jgi:hypothetical protein